MHEPLKVIDARGAAGRVMVLAAVAVSLLFAWFAIRWQLGNMLGELTPANQPNADQAAALAVRLSPRDPLARWLAAATEKETNSADFAEKSVRLYETVVRLSPHDFRWWIALGRAYEQAEQTDRAEAAFQRAVELAPAYTFPRWQLGNFYLRQNRPEEAFAELRKTTEKSIAYREQVFSLAWDYFDKDPKKVEALAADRPDVRATLASFFALRGQAEDSLRVWNSLTDEQKAPHQQTARDIAQGLHDRRFYRQSLEFARQTGIDPDAQAETVTNGGFEKPLGLAEDTLFGWRINRSEGRVDVLTDSSVKFEGARSLRLSFNGYVKPDLYNVVQLVAVQPGQKYRLSFMLRTENLKSGGPPLLKVTGGATDAVIAATAPFATGTAGWKELSLDFTVPPNADGISITTARASCAEQCPIIGTVWYDNFQLLRLSNGG